MFSFFSLTMSRQRNETHSELQEGRVKTESSGGDRERGQRHTADKRRKRSGAEQEGEQGELKDEGFWFERVRKIEARRRVRDTI